MLKFHDRTKGNAGRRGRQSAMKVTQSYLGIIGPQITEDYLAGCMPSFSAILTKSATDSACILCMTRPR